MTDQSLHTPPRPRVMPITTGDLTHALSRGWQDFRRAPLFGLFFSAFYVVCGAALWLSGAGTFAWTLVLSLGFPLVAPFAAVGLYEVSRRLELGARLDWSEILGVVWRERGRQMPWIGGVLLTIFLFWSFFAHMSFALFLGQSNLVNISTSWESLMTMTGLSMLLFELVAGGLVAMLVFSITVVSLPLLLEHEIDFVTAMLTSMRAVAQNGRTMMVWAAIIAILLFLAMVPVFLGLFLVLPLLAHATWHLYRRTLSVDPRES